MRLKKAPARKIALTCTIASSFRARRIDRLCGIARKLGLLREEALLFTAIALTDRCAGAGRAAAHLFNVPGTNESTRLAVHSKLAICCALYAAAKYHMQFPPSIAEVVDAVDGGGVNARVTAAHVVQMERLLLEHIGWRMEVLTPLHFLARSSDPHALDLAARRGVLLIDAFAGSRMSCADMALAAVALASSHRRPHASLRRLCDVVGAQYVDAICDAAMHADWAGWAKLTPSLANVEVAARQFT